MTVESISRRVPLNTTRNLPQKNRAAAAPPPRRASLKAASGSILFFSPVCIPTGEVPPQLRLREYSHLPSLQLATDGLFVPKSLIDVPRAYTARKLGSVKYPKTENVRGASHKAEPIRVASPFRPTFAEVMLICEMFPLPSLSVRMSPHKYRCDVKIILRDKPLSKNDRPTQTG